MKHVGDITKLRGEELPTVDCIAGGSPCQNLSIAGNGEGLDGEQSKLFYEQIRIVKELRQHDAGNGRTGQLIRPRWMVWENVPGAFSSNGGEDFKTVLSEIVRIAEPTAPDVPMPKGGWPRAGCLTSELGKWSVAWRVHDAQFWGVPQRRKRISVVADFGGLAAPEVLFERKGVSWDLEEGGEEEEEIAGHAGGGADLAISIQGNTVDRDAKQNGLGISVGVAHTINSTDRHAVCAGFKHKASGTANGIGYAEERAPTLTVGQQLAVCYPKVARPLVARMDGSPCIDRGPEVLCVFDARGNGDGRTAPTITGDHGRRVSDYTALCVGNGQMCNISMKPVSNTLDTMHDQQAVIVFDKEMYNCGERIGGEPQAREDTVAPTCRADSHPSGVAYNGTVRRLTPLECERLQGYPDNWTLLGEYVGDVIWKDESGNEYPDAVYKYKGADGKVHKTSDSARYKALGNSIALPFWAWLMRRISATYPRPALLGSLFDGIGGFPLCWEACNGPGTAIWASEIEEFAVSVTMKHFPEVSA